MARKVAAKRAGGPQGAADRPRMEGYGIPRHRKGILAWDWAVERLENSRTYWICTTRPDGRPHAMPVWGVWVEGAVCFSTARTSRKSRNLAANPAVTVHLESGDEAVILEGVAEEVTDRDSLARIDDAYEPKYAMRVLSLPGNNPIYAVRPRVAFLWRERDFNTSATRWRFPESSGRTSAPQRGRPARGPA